VYFAIFRTSAIQLEYEPSRPAGKLESGLPYSNGGVPPSLVMPTALGRDQSPERSSVLIRFWVLANCCRCFLARNDGHDFKSAQINPYANTPE
jgi:hypothetical protein